MYTFILHLVYDTTLISFSAVSGGALVVDGNEAKPWVVT